MLVRSISKSLAFAAMAAAGLGLVAGAGSPVHADTLVWSGATNGNWDTSATDLNWNDSTSSTNGVAYTDGSAVQFSGGATNLALTVGSGSGVSPASVDVMTGAGSYTLTNFTGDVSGITGATALNLDTGYTGTVTLKSANTFTGGTNLNGGTLVADSTLGTGAITFNGGTLQNNANQTINNNLVVNTGDTGTILVSGSGSTNAYGAIGGSTSTSGSPAATLTGGGTLTVIADYVRGDIGGDWSAFTGTVNVITNRNGSDLGFNGIDNALSAGNTKGNGGFYLNNGTLNLDGTATDSLTFSYQNEQNKSTLNGVNAVIGALSGTQYSTLGGYSYGGAPYHVLNYVVGGINTSTTFAGTLSDSTTNNDTNLYKIGTGSLTLQGADSFGGATEVNGGTLVLDGAVTNSTGITVDASGVGVRTGESDMRFAAGAGGTLAGDGSITANITNNGTLAPGDPAVSNTGTLTLVGNVDNEGALAINIGTSSASSLLAITGNLTLGANSALNLTGLSGGFDGSTYTIATFTGTLTGTFLTTIGLGAGYSVNYNANSITLSQSAVPEPATLALFMVAGAGLLLLRKRKTA